MGVTMSIGESVELQSTSVFVGDDTLKEPLTEIKEQSTQIEIKEQSTQINTNINTILNIYKYKYNTSTYDNVLKSSSKVSCFCNFQIKKLSELLGSSLLSCFLEKEKPRIKLIYRNSKQQIKLNNTDNTNKAK